MTRKDYVAIAKALADQEPGRRDSDGAQTSAYDQWSTDVLAIASALADLSGYDLNGNRRFDRDRFLAAVGMPVADSGPITSDEQDFGGCAECLRYLREERERAEVAAARAKKEQTR